MAGQCLRFAVLEETLNLKVSIDRVTNRQLLRIDRDVTQVQAMVLVDTQLRGALSTHDPTRLVIGN